MQEHFFSQKMTRLLVSLFMLAAALAGCSSGDTSSSATTPPPATGTAPVAKIQMTATPSTVFTDDSNATTITVNATDASNASVSGATITLSTSSGQLSSSTLITDSTGKATATFSSGLGFANQANRTVTITATSGSATATLPVQVVGSTLALQATGTSLPAGGASPVTLTVTASDKGGNPISGTAVSLTQTGTGTVTLTPTSGTTNTSGQLAVTVKGGTAGMVTVNASAAGANAAINFTVAATTSTFGIDLLTLNAGTGVVPTNPKNSAMQIGDQLVVHVNAPAPTTQVTFSTTIGSWLESGSTVYVAPAAGTATATLTTNSAGLANVEVVDLDNISLNLKDTLTVGMTAKIPDHISLQASPTVIPKSVGSTLGYSTITATVFDTTGAPVGNAPVAFSIVSGTGTNSGETVSPVVVLTAATTSGGLALGAAPTTFTAGSLSSGAAGVQVRATVIGYPISTGSLITLPAPSPATSSIDAAIIIGGTAGSVAFGQAAKIIDAGQSSTIYALPMSVLVADSNGNPAPLGTVVNISAWPIAWTTGSRGLGCDPDPDGMVWSWSAIDPVTGQPGTYVAGNGGTFYNEDINENLILDPLEDGTRKLYATGTVMAGGTTDSQITPLNSWGGTVVSTNSADPPGTATTDATGLATFNLTYTKSSAFFITTRIRAQTVVQGSPAVGQVDVPLPASQADASSTYCYLPKSPFKF